MVEMPNVFPMSNDLTPPITGAVPVRDGDICSGSPVDRREPTLEPRHLVSNAGGVAAECGKAWMPLSNSRRQDAGGRFGKSGRRLQRIASLAKPNDSRCSLASSGRRPPPWMRSRYGDRRRTERGTSGERQGVRNERSGTKPWSEGTRRTVFVLARHERANRVRGVTSGVSIAETNAPTRYCCTMWLPSRMTEANDVDTLDDRSNAMLLHDVASGRMHDDRSFPGTGSQNRPYRPLRP